MKTVMITLIGVSSIVWIIMTQSSINVENIGREEISDSFAMTQTMQELAENSQTAIRNKNEMMAMFLQEMIARVDEEIDLTVISHECDYEKGIMDIEAVGKLTLPGNRIKKVSVRRCMKLEK